METQGESGGAGTASRRVVLRSAALTVAGIFVGRGSFATAKSIPEQYSADQFHEALIPVLNRAVSLRGPYEYRTLPSCVIKLSISDPSLRYDLSFDPKRAGSVARLSPDSRGLDPDAAIEVDAGILEAMMAGDYRLEQALASNRVIISGDRNILAPLRSSPDKLGDSFGALERKR